MDAHEALGGAARGIADVDRAVGLVGARRAVELVVRIGGAGDVIAIGDLVIFDEGHEAGRIGVESGVRRRRRLHEQGRQRVGKGVVLEDAAMVVRGVRLGDEEQLSGRGVDVEADDLAEARIQPPRLEAVGAVAVAGEQDREIVAVRIGGQAVQLDDMILQHEAVAEAVDEGERREHVGGVVRGIDDEIGDAAGEADEGIEILSSSVAISVLLEPS